MPSARCQLGRTIAAQLKIRMFGCDLHAATSALFHDCMLASDQGPLVAVREFRAAQRWVHQHRFRFRRDPRELVDGWERS